MSGRKRLSIKCRVALWYTVFMILIVLTVFFFVLAGSREALVSGAKKELLELLEDAVDELEYEDGELETEDVDFYQDGNYMAVYDGAGLLLAGLLPEHFQYGGAFKERTFRNVRDQGEEYCVYDYRLFPEGGEGVWLRGVAPYSGALAAIKTISRMAVVIFPILILLVALGGYSVTRRAFRPVERISRIAGEISRSGDFSKRLRLDSGKDEIGELARIFDHMLARLEHAYQTEKQFTNDASHELRTPIAVIISQAEYALENTSDPEETKEALEIILRQAGKMSSLVSRLLALCREENGTAKLHLEPVSVSELAEMVMMEEEAQSGKKHIQMIPRLEPGVTIMADQDMVTRLLINLIANAIQYGREHGKIVVTVKGEDGCAVLRVEDDGIGIAPEHIERIWDRFYQVDASRAGTGEGGSGLGLSMVRSIVRAHEGTVEAESVPGEGSRFTVRLPFEPSGRGKEERYI